VRLRILLCRCAIAVVGLACLLAEPHVVRAQAEEIPPEPAAQHGVATPTPPSKPPSQATAKPQSSSQETPVPGLQSKILIMPYFGFSVPVGDGWAGFNPSPRFGALLGWQATDRLSVGGECDVDYARPDLSRGVGQASGTDFWDGFLSPPRYYIDLTASPLVSFRAGQVRLGPKIGWFTSRGHDDIEGGRVPAAGSGVLLGFNFGLLVPYRSISVGGLFTGSFRFFTSTNEPSGAHQTMGLLAAVLL
jgi:hypothetical protein